MSLKGVELQIAIPKTFEAGKIADQAHQQVLAHQAHANEALKREIQRKQTIVNVTERTDEIDEDDDGATGGEYFGSRHDEKNKNIDKSKQKNAQHPFKGNFVDFSG